MNERTQEHNETTVSTPADREIRTERVFDAPRDRVYAAFTDPELIPQWWGPRETETKVDLMDQDADQVAGGMVAAGLGLDLGPLLDSTALDEDIPLKDVFVPGVQHLFDVDG